ncbi:MAG: zf-HC2 domain-containing protein [Firmicutes bacterium]|nr:zf-HC2 domain-containing protein [Bacillota bacterium]
MIAHHVVRRQLSAYLDEELRPEEAAAVRAHLAACAPCAAELEELRATRALLRRLPAPQVPAGFLDDLRARLAAEGTGRRAWWPPVLVARPAVLVAAVVAVLILVGLPVARGRLERLRAAEVGPDLFVRQYVSSAAADPLVDRAFLGLVVTDANLRLIGEDPRAVGGSR